MKKKAIFVLFVFAAAGFAAAQNATTVYVEGDSTMKDVTGRLRDLDIGDSLKPGETVITKATGRADLELANRSSIVVRPNTVFTLGEVELEGEKQSVLSTTVGSVAFRLNKFSGTGPVVRTNSAVAGVRGTEFTIYAGMDGSSLIAVEGGEVEVEAQGRTVGLSRTEAVEILPGQAPGEKFVWLGKEQDFSAWNAGKLEAFLADPAGSVLMVEARLAYFRGELEKILPELAAAEKEAAGAYDELRKAVEAKDEKKAGELREELLKGVGERRRVLFLNVRYHALSYLSMRRYVLGGMYVEMRSRYIMKPNDPVYEKFVSVYDGIVTAYEKDIVPHLVEADI